MRIDTRLTPMSLRAGVDRTFALAASKAASLDRTWKPTDGTPVFTVRGRYATRGWTEWTQGFQYGCLLLAGEGAGDPALVSRGRARTLERMGPHLTHVGVHDHGFNNLSTYGTLLRLQAEGACPEDDAAVCRQAIAVSGAVQAARWTPLRDGLGFIHSFNGAHSLFVDTLRSLRILVASHRLGHVLMGENDERIDLLQRALTHAVTTDRHLVFHGGSGHTFDVRGRTAHEGLFNCRDGRFRARGTQQGYSPFSTWTRGLSWAMLGFAEQLEVLSTFPAKGFPSVAGFERQALLALLERAAVDTCEHWIEECTASDGIPYWDDGAPGLGGLGDWRSRPAEPFNDFEPVDASAAAIAAQGLLRLGRVLGTKRGARYRQAGLSVAQTLMAAPYLSEGARHQGLLLHSVYHWPNGWDFVPRGRKVTCGESSLWGDYHLLELALLVRRLAGNGPYPTFLSGIGEP